MVRVCRNKLLSVFVLVLICVVHALPGRAADYYSLDEFFKVFPEQQKMLEGFEEQVRKKKAAPLKTALNVSVAIVYPGEQVSDYWRRSYTSFSKRLNEYGIVNQLHVFFIKPTAPLREQSEAFRKALAINPDYLVFTLDAMRHQRLIEPVLVKGRPKMILQNITTPMKDWDGKQPFIYVGFDHAAGAVMLARYFAEATEGKGKYGALLPAQGFLSDERGDTFIEWLDMNTDLELVSVFRTGIDREKAKRATLQLLRKHPEVKFIYACSTDIALGAIDALKETGLLHKVMVNGWGGGSPEIEAIRKGEMDVTVMRINDDNGVAMADAIILDQLGGQFPLVYPGRLEIITSDFEPERLKKLMEESFRYSGILGEAK